MRPRDNLYVAVLICLAPSLVHAECRLWPQTFDQYTNDFYLSATPSSSEAAPGEVIGVELSLTINDFHEEYKCYGLGLVAAYDPKLGELLGEPVYAEAFEEFAGPAFFYPLRERDGLKGFVIGFPIRSFADPGRFIDTPVKIGTVYFRLHGEPGDSLEVSFPDDKLADSFGFCVRTQLSFSDKVTRRASLDAHSKTHARDREDRRPGTDPN
jgi:hypothetical protein